MDLQNYQQKMQKIEDDRYDCPSFNSYSSDRLAEIAAKTADEFERESSVPVEFIAGEFKRESSVPVEFIAEERDEEEEEDDDFEFSLVPEHSEAFSDENFYDGSVFPVFNRKLLLDEGFAERDRGDEAKDLPSHDVDSSVRIALKNLFLQGKEDNDLEPQSSSSSSEVDELESVPPGTYCVWRPKKSESFPTECKKSNSTGSASKRWRLRDMLRRINSDGNNSYVFLTPKKEENSKSKESGMVLKVTGKTTKVKKNKAVDKEASPSPSPSPSPLAAHEAFYLRNKAAKEGEKRKSYLPYRRDLVGFFANVNAGGFGKEFPFH